MTSYKDLHRSGIKTVFFKFASTASSLIFATMATHLVWRTLAAAAAAVVAVDHQIHTLPGYADKLPIKFNQFAGHLALPSIGKKFFYWLIES